MRLLIDTQILLWSLMEPSKLGAKGKQLLMDPEHTVFLSAVSLWEIRIKESIGKLKLPGSFGVELGRLQFEELPMTVAHTAALAGLPMRHRDPFDRMLVAQAMAEGLKLFTADRQLEDYGDWVLKV